jgi:hypothetical protein
VHGKIGRRYSGKPGMTAQCLVDVTAWRRRRLVETGFPEPLADRLAADAAVDVHALLQLVDRGCPPELAARILSPLTLSPLTLSPLAGAPGRPGVVPS